MVLGAIVGFVRIAEVLGRQAEYSLLRTGHFDVQWIFITRIVIEYCGTVATYKERFFHIDFENGRKTFGHFLKYCIPSNNLPDELFFFVVK